MFGQGRYTAGETFYDIDDNTFHPELHYFVGGNSKVYGAALFRLHPSDFDDVVHPKGIAPAWPISYADLEPYYVKAEHMYWVHGMLVIYEQPADVAAFDEHYFNVHVPLAKRLPGLRRYAVSRNPAAVRGPKPYLVAELDWDDMASLRTDFASPLGRDTAGDVDRLATLCPGIRSTIVELEDL